MQLARWDRPAGWQLLLAPCWRVGRARRRSPRIAVRTSGISLLFLVGAIAMRGAGCTYNDILDRKLDAGVERTRGRPLPSGRVTSNAPPHSSSPNRSSGWLSCFASTASRSVGIASLGIVAVYPLMKRVTSWPQAVLGLAFSWGALMGGRPITARSSGRRSLLYASAFCWTIGYDTIYAQQDARDDAIVGIRSTARLFGAHARLGVGLFYALAAALAQAALIGGRRRASSPSSAGSASAAHLAWQVANMDAASPATALKLFRSNRDAGLLLFFGIALSGWTGL